MKYIFFTYIGDSLPIAYRLQQEGHEVIVGVVEDKKNVHADSEKETLVEDELSKKRRLSLYDGMLVKESADKLIKRMLTFKNQKDYFVFFDRNNLFKYAEKIMDLPFHGNFPTEKDYLFEMDRDEAKKFVKLHYPKLRVAEIKDFSTIQQGIEFLEKADELWVLKGKDDSAKTFIPDVDDVELAKRQIIHTLETNKVSYEQAGYILELLISPMIELTPQKMYYNGIPLATVLNIENKPFGSSNLSIQTGCAADLVFPTIFEDRINQIAFPPIVDELAKQHKGLFYWDASILINKRTGKMYFGEFCSNRPGYNQLFSELAQCPTVNHYFDNIIRNKNPFKIGTVACSTTIFNPVTDEDNNCHPPKDSPIHFKPGVEKDLWLWDARKNGEKIVTAGDDWNLAVLTGSGTSITEAVSKLFKNIDNFSFVGAYYRPKSDYVSLDYPTSILNRLNYGLERNLYSIPFDVSVGAIK